MEDRCIACCIHKAVTLQDTDSLSRSVIRMLMSSQALRKAPPPPGGVYAGSCIERTLSFAIAIWALSSR